MNRKAKRIFRDREREESVGMQDTRKTLQNMRRKIAQEKMQKQVFFIKKNEKV